jgi:hypothetical protein
MPYVRKRVKRDCVWFSVSYSNLFYLKSVCKKIDPILKHWGDFYRGVIKSSLLTQVNEPLNIRSTKITHHCHRSQRLRLLASTDWIFKSLTKTLFDPHCPAKHMGMFGTQWNNKKLEYNCYSDELICQTNFRLSRIVLIRYTKL